MKILGFDPGFALTGWALIEYDGGTVEPLAGGLVATQKTAKRLVADDNIRRAQHIYRQVWRLMSEAYKDGYRPTVDLVAAESMSYPPNASTAAKMSMTYAAIASVCEHTQTPFVQFSPGQIKLDVAGTKKASKEQMKHALCQTFPGLGALVDDVPPSKQEHFYDALGAAVCATTHELSKAIIRGSRGGYHRPFAPSQKKEKDT